MADGAIKCASGAEDMSNSLALVTFMESFNTCSVGQCRFNERVNKIKNTILNYLGTFNKYRIQTSIIINSDIL